MSIGKSMKSFLDEVEWKGGWVWEGRAIYTLPSPVNVKDGPE